MTKIFTTQNNQTLNETRQASGYGEARSQLISSLDPIEPHGGNMSIGLSLHQEERATRLRHRA